MRKIILLLAIIFIASSGYAQQVRPAPSGKIYHEISQLRHLVNVLYFAAHPDDENTRLLAWLVNDKNIHTAYLSLTRGDGGQNILGSEQGAALGYIRTHELMEARKIDGAEQFFTRAVDFGFSKNYQETFKHWDEHILTSDAVWAIRKFRPDVVICRFPPNAMAGHGQHAASAIVAADAFKDAGDKSQFTEQLKYYSAWQPKRLLFNSYHFGSANTTSEDQLKITVGEYLPTFGMGSGELAGLSRSVHKSQGAGTPSVPGIQTEYFKLVEGDTMTKSLFDGIDITWNRVGRKDIGDDIKGILEDYDFMHPDESIPALLAVRKKIEEVKDDYWRNEKLEEINKIILDCAGFLAELYTNQPQAIDGQTLPFSLHIIARSKTPVDLINIQWPQSDSTLNMSINHDSLITIAHTITIPDSTPITEPYWMSQPSSNPDLFSIPDDTLFGLPETPDNLNAVLTLKIGDESFYVPVPLSHKKLDPVKGDVVEQLRIVPGAVLEFTTKLLITQSDGSIQTGIRIRAFKDIKNADLLIMNDNIPRAIRGINLYTNEDTVIQLNYSAQDVASFGKGDFYLTATLSEGKHIYNKSLNLIQYNHIPTLQYFTMPYAKVLRKNWKCTVKRIGYIEGAGDYTATLLRLAGLDVDVLKESDFVSASRLKKYDAIITGVRAVNVEKRMSYWLPVLLQYVHNGGTLVMQYNTLQDLSTTKIGPYPFTLSTLRVTEEDAKITFLHPDSRILNYPNKITDDDFKGWVQERGLYFASKWDDRYTPLFQMNDTGEEPLKGSTLYTKYGSGNYIYTSLSFFRQLPAGNKGSIRLLMNMLSVGK
ncbi:MAG TPA: PIG-L family deacetylase [Flavipsychrobacter sp.]|nr:PIG-L family deacetylase [Flavipsychrobacter sp.]